MSSGTRPSRTFLKLSPLLIPFVALFMGGLFMAVAQSFGFFLPIPHEGGLFDAYRELFRPHILASAGHSLWVAAVSSTLAVSIGSIMAYQIWQLPERSGRMAIMYKIPLILPHIAVAFIILVFLSQSGVFASIGHQLGLVKTVRDFPPLLHGTGGAGMILAYVFKEVPFVIILALAVLRRMDPRLVETARMLGARPMTVFLRVVVPHMRPALHTAFIILFLYGFGAFDIPFLLGESSPAMLSIETYNLYFRRDLVNRPTAMAILVCMFLFSAVFIILYTRIAARISGKDRKL
ncbi:ABC transporter permease subunit [uncultured Pseudodesulfovibrio sp.]|uniref:ABC transporter permease n=1 Tax=uncultured Pseudodesulfovibrio sp. TaxID=2035858 RepID=UPI0029C71D62|nr:ABC transporter permease subunit [uncultured Pseudodesulfovibrio sp.]